MYPGLVGDLLENLRRKENPPAKKLLQATGMYELFGRTVLISSENSIVHGASYQKKPQSGKRRGFFIWA
jgi:hypothetical protein